MKNLSTTIVALLGLTFTACGGNGAFSLTAGDNDAALLATTLTHRHLRDGIGPVALDGHARVFAVTGGSSKQIVGFDLQQGKKLWAVNADVASRISVGGNFIVEVEGKDIACRDLATGAEKWRHALGGALIGVAADADHAYLATNEGKKDSTLTAYTASTGKVAWSVPVPGPLGAPAAQGGLVFAPFMSQWLSVLDAQTGTQLTRVRGVDEQIGFVETTSDATYFGSTQGVFRLDDKSASGKRSTSTYGRVKLPQQLSKAGYGFDGYDAVEANYSAADRTRILWRSDVKGDTVAFNDGGVAVHYFRFLLGMSPDGEIRWAYSQPRVDLVGSAHLGSVIAAVSQTGELVALNPATGSVRYRHALSIDAAAPVIGATFDADGWVPPDGTDEPNASGAALIAIARDHDARFDRIKELAVAALAKLPGAQVTVDLLGLLDDSRAPAKLKDAVATLLVSRHDIAGLDALIAALQRHTDIIAGTTAGDVALFARAIGALGPQLDAASRPRAVAALAAQLDDPNIDLNDTTSLLSALGKMKSEGAGSAVRRHLLLYRTDPEFAGDHDWSSAVVESLLALGSPADREALRFASDDTRTLPVLAAPAAEAIRRATH